MQKPHYAKYIDGHFGFPRVLGRIKEAIYTKVAPLQMKYALTKEPVPFNERLTLTYKDIKPSECWGEVFDCGWFHITGVVPQEHLNKKLALLIDLSGEGCVYDDAGVPVRGITNGSSAFDTALGAPVKRVLRGGDYIKDGRIDIWIDAGNNDLFGNLCGEGRVKEADIAVCNDYARDLYYDALVLGDLLKCLEADSARYYSVLYALRKMTYEISDFTDEEFIRARAVLATELNKKNGDSSLEVAAVGHSHMDLAWLWPIRETKRKVARTFATQLEMIERYKGYVYNISQPQQLEWLKAEHPKLYERVKKCIFDGSIELQGGTWVESDTYMPSGESLVRQFLYGVTFTEKEFGYRPTLLWLPDVFGYSQAIPQIAKKSGINYFSTIKLSWNALNTFPYHTFFWEGVDGSKLLAHMPPEGTYNSAAAPTSVKAVERKFIEKGISDKALMVFGIGDGGGGAGTQHLEQLKREGDLAGLPRVKMQSALSFFNDIDKETGALCTYKGELYMENHQGTLTTIGMIKRNNRLCENKLRYAEALCSTAEIKSNFAYPKEKLDALWKEVLLYQFHDILPGSSIIRVYTECKERYEVILTALDSIIADAHSALCENEGSFSAYNFSPCDREEIVCVRSEYIKLAVQANSNIYKCLPLGASKISANKNTMENENLRVVFDPSNGNIVSLFDKVSGIEAVKAGRAFNELRVFTDLGDSWDICIDYRNRKTSVPQVKAFKIEKSDYKSVCKIVYRYKSSDITQLVILKDCSRVVEVLNTVDWAEEDKMLRVDFGTDIKSDSVKCDMQFGSYERTALNNNSLDYAQFEICAHKFIDFSSKDYGVAILNDSKYGYYAKGGDISLNLIRCQKYPGSFADKGAHEFRYGIFVHKYNEYGLDVEHEAYKFNNPLIIKNGTAKPMLTAKSDRENIIIETLKKTESNNGYAIRLYENNGLTTRAEIEFGVNVKKAYLCNLLEDKLSGLTVKDNKVSVSFAPREIHTIVFEV